MDYVSILYLRNVRIERYLTQQKINKKTDIWQVERIFPEDLNL